MFGFDWNGNGERDFFDDVMDLMIIDEVTSEEEDEEGEGDDGIDDRKEMDWL